VVLGKGEPRHHSGLISFNTQNKALQFADLADSCFLKPGIELLSCPCAQHLCKLLDQVIGEIHFCMALAKLEKGFLFFFIQIFRPSQKQEGHLSRWQRSWRELSSFGPVLFAIWKPTNQMVTYT